MIIYDNINFTLQKTSQCYPPDQCNNSCRSLTPMKFTCAAYTAALFVLEWNKKAGLHNQMKLNDLKPTAEQKQQLADASKHNIHIILLEHTPGIVRIWFPFIYISSYIYSPFMKSLSEYFGMLHRSV